MKRLLYLSFVLCFSSILISQESLRHNIQIFPIEHASFVLQRNNLTIIVDPVGKAESYATFNSLEYILITDNHEDHFDAGLINILKTEDAKIIGPKVVIDALGYGYIIKNGETLSEENLIIKAIPMYNLTEDRINFHEKGRGNGYVLTIEEKKIYISGDTEDIPEMRELNGINMAFICMNLPYTMTVEQAASAVLDFKPQTVYPYHYRCKDGFSDIEKFKKLVSEDKNIEVKFLEWYKAE